MQQDQRHGRRAGLAVSLRDFAAWEALQQVLHDISTARQTVAASQPEQSGGSEASGSAASGPSTPGAHAGASSLRVIDIGGGTGGLAVAIAELGHSVTVVDPNPDALAALTRRAADAGVAGRVDAVQGDTETLAQLHPEADVDLVCCHGVLEYVDDPYTSLQSIAGVLAPGGYLSLVVAQRMAAVLGRALAGQFEQARQALVSPDARWGSADPLPRRFDAIGIGDLVRSAGLVVHDSHGIRVFSDLVPSTHLDSEADRAALLELEREASRQGEVLGQLGAAVHLLARRD